MPLGSCFLAVHGDGWVLVGVIMLRLRASWFLLNACDLRKLCIADIKIHTCLYCNPCICCWLLRLLNTQGLLVREDAHYSAPLMVMMPSSPAVALRSSKHW